MLCFSGFELYSRWVPLVFCNGAKLRRVASRISNRFLSHSLQFCTVAAHIVAHVSTKSSPVSV